MPELTFLRFFTAVSLRSTSVQKRNKGVCINLRKSPPRPDGQVRDLRENIRNQMIWHLDFVSKAFGIGIYIHITRPRPDSYRE